MPGIESFNLPKAEPPRDQWSKIALSISLALRETRSDFYEVCADVLKKIPSGNSAANNPENNEFADDSTLIKVMVCQLCLAFYYVASKQYISPPHGAEFADLLSAQVLGDNLPLALDYITLLRDQSKPLPKLYLFFCLVTEDITGNRNPADGMLLLKSVGVEVVRLCFLAVARAFSDERATQDIDSDLKPVEDYIETLWTRFLKRVNEV